MEQLPYYASYANTVMLLVILFIGVYFYMRRKPHTPAQDYRRHTARLKAMDFVPLAMITIDVDGHVVFWNKAAEQMFAWTAGEMEGKSIDAIIPERYRDRHQKGIELAKKTGVSRMVEKPMQFEALHRFDEEFPVELTLRRWTDDAGSVFYTGVIRNIRIKKEMQKELALYHAGEEVYNTGVFEWDIITGRVVCSNGFNRIFETDDFISEVGYLLKRVYYEDRELVQQKIEAALQDGNGYDINYRVSSVNGKPKKINCKTEIIKDENNIPKCMIGVIRKL